MTRRLLDLYCKAGGAGRGYADVGFEVVGVDVEPQPRYPFEFVCGNALSVLKRPRFVAGFDVIHASPPCKVHTRLRAFAGKHHADLVGRTRAALVAAGLPYVIENVPGAPLRSPVVLCGSMFALGVRRHRLFELGRWKAAQPSCRHAEQDATSPGYMVQRSHSGRPVKHRSTVVGVYGRGQGLGPGEVDLWRAAMGIDWMTRDELAQAIPPAYTEWIGARLMKELS